MKLNFDRLDKKETCRKSEKICRRGKDFQQENCCRIAEKNAVQIIQMNIFLCIWIKVSS